MPTYPPVVNMETSMAKVPLLPMRRNSVDYTIPVRPLLEHVFALLAACAALAV